MGKNKKKVTIAFLGSLPPPFGGFSIGLQRLIDRLGEEGYDYIVYDLLYRKTVRPGGISTRIRSRLWWLLRYIFLARENLICCHYIDWRLRSAIGMMSLLGKQTLISIGGQSLNDSLERGGWLKRKIIAVSLRRYSFVIAHNEVIKQLCLSLGVKAGRVEVIPSFIPPVVKEKDTEEIPGEVSDFIASHTPIISAGAFKICFYNGQDLYGVDMCVELCANLKKDYPRIGLVFCLPIIGDDGYFSRIKREIREKHIEENFLFITQPLNEVYPIWRQSHIFLRPTATDGDALSLREALYFKIPSLASDVVPRPEGTVIFKSRDIEDFTARVKMVWENYDDYRSRLEATEVENGLKKTLAVYDSLTSQKD